MKSIKEILNLQEKKSSSVSGIEHFEPYEDIYNNLKAFFKDEKLLDELGKIWDVDEIGVEFSLQRGDVDAGDVDIEKITVGQHKFANVEAFLKDAFTHCHQKSNGVLKHKLAEFMSSANGFKKVAYNFEEHIQETIYEKATDGEYENDEDDGDDYSTARPGVTN